MADSDDAPSGADDEPTPERAIQLDREAILGWIAAQRRHLRRAGQRRVAATRRWLETTENLLHISVLAFVPLLVAIVTALSNALAELSFLLFPPLASGAYTLFANPEGEYASPERFVIGLTTGALAGWVALLFSGTPTGVISPTTAGLAILLVAVVTRGFDVEEPAAFSTALLVLVTDQASPQAYVISVTVFGTLVAGAFYIWRQRVYQQRATLLYGTVQADDHVLVPMIGDIDSELASFGGHLAAAHDAGKVVLLDIVSEQEIAAAERTAVANATVENGIPPASNGDGVDGSPTEPDHVETASSNTVESSRQSEPVESSGAAETATSTDSVPDGVRERVTELESIADRLNRQLDVACEVAVAAGDPIQATMRTAREANCDLVVPPFSTETESYVTEVFESDVDAVALRASDGHESWPRVLVMVARPGDTAHAMLDFAERLAGDAGHVSVCTCIDSQMERRRAEEKLSRLVETEAFPVETRVVKGAPGSFAATVASSYDLVLVGATRGDGPLLSLLSDQDLEQFSEAECDIGVVERGPLR